MKQQEIRVEPVDNPDKIRRGDIIWLYRQPLIVAIHILGGVLALAAPDDVLSSSPKLREIVAFMASMIPLIANSARHSQFPEVTQLYGAFMLSTAPYWLYVATRWPDWEKAELLMLETSCRSTGKLMLLHVWPLFLLIALYVYFFKVAITDFSIAPFHHSRWALAAVGPIFYCWMVTGGYAAVAVPFSVLTRYWKGK